MNISADDRTEIRRPACLVFRQIGLCLYLLMMGIIAVLLLFYTDRIAYSYKRSFLLENGTLLCIGFLAAAFFSILFCRRKAFNKVLERHSDRAILTLTEILFLLQIYFCYSAYFYTGWDAAVINNGAAELALSRQLSDTVYFSRYPNNLLLVFLFSLVKRADGALGILDTGGGVMGLLSVQCLISSLTGLLLFKIVRNLNGCRQAWAAWLCYLVLTGSSGWLLIPYSDSFGLFLPTAILYLYQLQRKKDTLWRWAAIGGLSYFGYHIKPQIFLVFLAILLAECTSGIRRRWRGILCAAAGLAAASLCYNVLSANLRHQLDSEKAFGAAHFAMMGLNSSNNGGYLRDDVIFSDGFATKAERGAANLGIIRQRLQDMGHSGLIAHLAKKLLTNYGDGTFAWEMEGNFFSQIIEPKNLFLSPLLRRLIWGGDQLNFLCETVRQGVWLFLLAASLGLIGHKDPDNALLATIWAIAGLTLFGLLFEARARYLYLYSPFYIIAGISGAGRIRTLSAFRPLSRKLPE